MHNKQSKTANQMPESDLLMEYKLGCGFHFKPKAHLKLKKKAREKETRKNFLIGVFSWSQIQFDPLQIYFSNFLL